MPKLLGQILMEASLVNIDDINDALEIQKSTGQKMVEILISMGVITEEELEMALEFQKEEI